MQNLFADQADAVTLGRGLNDCSLDGANREAYVTQVTVRASSVAVSAVLPPEFSAVQDARALVHSALSDWNAQRISDDVALVASEMVANALLHGLRLSLDAGQFGQGRAGRVEIQLVNTGTHVICTVRDPSPLPPVCRPADDADLGGRGLQLIESLSLCWGWTPAGRAKTVWAIFALDSAANVLVREPAMSLRAG
jgi:anti-sigma regulatory factor (Ser/Thr protein kinase)